MGWSSENRTDPLPCLYGANFHETKIRRIICLRSFVWSLVSLACGFGCDTKRSTDGVP